MEHTNNILKRTKPIYKGSARSARVQSVLTTKKQRGLIHVKGLVTIRTIKP